MTETTDDCMERWLRDTLPLLGPPTATTSDAYPAVRGRIRVMCRRRRRRQRFGVLAVAAVTAVVVALAVQLPPFGSQTFEALPLNSPVVIQPLLGEVYRHADRLVHVDPLTLKPVGTLSAAAPVDFQYSYSPSGDRLAVVHGNGSNDDGLTLLDPRTLRVVGTFSTGVRLPVLAIDWTRSGIVEIAGACCSAQADTLVRINPSTGTVTQTPLHGSLQRAVATPDALYVVVGPISGIGPSRISRLDGSGTRVLPLTQIRSGLDPATAHPRHQITPALAVDPTTNTAYVLSPGAPVAKAAFTTGTVTYHTLAQRHSLADLLAGWLIPPAAGKEDIYGADWTAQWLGNGLLVTAGSTTSPHTSTPTGMRILNVGNWTQTTLDKTADGFVVADGALIALHEQAQQSGGDLAGSAVGYDPQGNQLFTVGNTHSAVWNVDVVGSTAFAYHYCAPLCEYDVINTDTGQVLATRQTYDTYNLATPLTGRTSQGY